MNLPELIHWSFSRKSHTLLAVTEQFGEFQADLFKFLEVLALVEVSRANSYSNTVDKLEMESSCWNRFLSFGSELFFANEFFKQKFNIELILGSEKIWSKPNRKSPDFYASKDGSRFLVEVSRISGDETTSEVAYQISSIVKESNFRVEIEYSEDFSIPVIKTGERDERHKLIEKFVDEFRETILTVNPNYLPESRNILGCQVTFTKPLKGKRGYYAGHNTSSIIIPEEKIYQHIASVMESKAQKRINWDNSQQAIPYIIALDIQQDFIFKERLISLLFGKRCHFSRSTPQYFEPNLVSIAKRQGWQKILEDVGFSQKTKSFITEPGLLIASECTLKNVTGIIAKIGAELFYIPNPFADQAINSLDAHTLVPGGFKG